MKQRTSSTGTVECDPGRAGGRRRIAGVTVIEALVGLVVFAIMFVSFSSLSLTTMQANSEARRITAATNLARDKVEEMREVDFATLATGADASRLTEAGLPTGPGAIYTRSWTVSAGPTAATRDVTVTVKWKLDGADRQVSVQTLIGN